MGIYRLPLKSGVTPDAAAHVLSELISKAGSIGPSVGIAELQQRYLDWAERVESRLHYLTDAFEVVTMADTARGRAIRELRPDAPRPWPLVDAEVKLQVSVLDRMLTDLKARMVRMPATDSQVVVVDTNILLHYKPLDELPWHDITGSAQVRIVLPLRVIEELDQKKYAPRRDLASRSRRLLPQLRSWIGAAGAPGSIVKNVTLEIMVDPGPRQRPSDADEEILAACRELIQFGATRLSLLSGDTAMMLRAQAEGTAIMAMPDGWLRNPANQASN